MKTKDEILNSLKEKKAKILTSFFDDQGFIGINGFVTKKLVTFRFQISNGLGWDHVSVSTPKRCPTWDEMNFFKDLFFSETETVIQYHPAKEDYVNNHPYCLHLWRPQNTEIPKPPKNFV